MQVLRGAVGTAEAAAEGVRRFHRVHPVRAGFQRLRVVSDRSGDGIGGHRPAVVGLQHAEDVAPAAVGPGQANGQVVGFGAAVDHEHPVEAGGGQRQQAFGELADGRIVEARVGVQQRPLPRRFGDHARVAVAQHGDVVEHVQVRAALHVDQVVAPAALDVRRLRVVVLLRAGEAGVAAGQQGLRVRQRLGIAVEAQQRRRRRAQGQPGRGMRRGGEERRLDAAVQAQLHAEEATAATQRLAFLHDLAIGGGAFQALQPQAPMRAAQAATAVAMALPGAGFWCLHQAAIGHMQFDAEGAGGGLFGAVDMGLRQAILPVQAAGRGWLRAQQVLVEARLLPVARLVMRAEHAEVYARDGLFIQLREQGRAGAQVRRGRLQPRCLQDGHFHQRERYGSGGVEDLPFMGDVVADVLVARVDAELLLAAEH